MLTPERRTRSDILAALAIVAVISVIGALIWWSSDARATLSRPADSPSQAPTQAAVVPATLVQRWQAPSAVSTTPIVLAGTVITADGAGLIGRDPHTGDLRWEFARDLPLCGVSWIYQYAVAVYPDSRGCGQVSTVDAATGTRGPTRSGAADPDVVFSSDGSAVLAAGRTRLEMWRSDMVRTIGYGEVDARFKPVHLGRGKGCALLSAAASSTMIAAVRGCPGEPDVTVSLIRPEDGGEDDEPAVRDIAQPGVSAESGAHPVAVTGNIAAVYLPTPRPRVSIVDDTGIESSSVALPSPASSANTPGAVSRTGALVTWWTGDSVLVFNAADLTYRYTVSAEGAVRPLGPASTMAGKLLIPVTGGIGVFDAGTGVRERIIAVDRPALAPGVPVSTAVVGDTVLEQRGPTLVALG